MLYFYALFALALPLVLAGVVIDKPDSLPSAWTKESRTPANQAIKLTFALKNERLDELERILLSVSTPGHPQYGNFRKPAEMQRLIAPTPMAVQSVMDWLQRSSFSRYAIIEETHTADLLSVHTTIGAAEALLDCTYFDYRSTMDRSVVVSRVELGTQYTVADRVAEHLYFVSPTVRFPQLQRRLRMNPQGPSAIQQNPGTLRALYNLGDVGGVAPNNLQAIASFQNQLYDITDCQKMWTDFHLDACTITNVPADQGSGYRVEASLDTQYITSLGQRVPTQAWYTAGPDFKNTLIELSMNILAAAQNGSAPYVFTMSYGGTESQFGLSFVTKMNSQFALIGAAGISFLVSSGDSGAGGICEVGAFEPEYPSASPYVTTVGGLEGGTAGDIPLGESTWRYGGGGFSNYAAQQSWQKEAVTYYLAHENALPAQSKYNASGRGFPDIAAQSVDFLIYQHGVAASGSGTSASTPTFGGIFSLLNDLRFQGGMKQLGFLNPFIYQTAAADPTAFHDCTKGYIKGCGPTSTTLGFNTYAKWDPASGYGSPNYPVLATHVQKTGEYTKRWV